MRYVYRTGDQHVQVIHVLVSTRRDAAAARRFFRRALTMLKVAPSEVVTDANPVIPRMLDDLLPPAGHHVERHANNPIEADHSQLKHRAVNRTLARLAQAGAVTPADRGIVVADGARLDAVAGD
ncbi:integrase catalytic region [Micromonospora sp. ATCC 39149]|uniref:DDE-type integrase/transposase/recombinase n=1 Tax=Micromonospora carbonacea TaxID=47853 RepID=A0A7D6C5Q3_9ACTN|nr:integrase catalytic region [Micromonospora sp. ATCC 39149]QLJ98484.1 DDE-type integrase/transposase/recombinase [Micromonospora carbonacea]